MERLDSLLKMPEYVRAQQSIEEQEQDRIYCGHTREHFKDVARIAYILALEEQMDVSKELIYTTAFLHDIGRVYEYNGDCSHESGSVLMALNLLPQCGFNEDEVNLITGAIATHREKERVTPKTLGSILYRADKLSRDCATCEAESTCKWSADTKNMTLTY